MADQNRPAFNDDTEKRTMQFFWLADYSASMGGARIESLNQAIREVLPEIVSAAAENPSIPVMMRAIKFSSYADWHVGPSAVALESFVWSPLEAMGATSTAGAINLLCDELEMEKMPRRGVPPVCVLISDGFCTDSQADYDKAIARLNNLFWGQKAIRLAIAIGNEQEYDEQELLKFVNHPEVGLLKATNSAELVTYIRWASTSAVTVSSRPVSSGAGDEPSFPAPPDSGAPKGQNDPDSFIIF